MAGQERLKTLHKGLEALERLNADGLTDITTLSRRLAMSRQSTYRIVQTLVEAGYCLRLPNSTLYQVAPRALALSRGVHEGEILTSVAIGVIEQLGRTVKWPVTFATPDDGHMLVRVTTDRTTSLALEHISPGFLASMLKTTTGLLYLALERPEIAEPMLETILEAEAAVSLSLSRKRLEELLDACRSDGFLLMDTQYSEACLGVPVMIDGRPRGGVVMRYIRSAMPRERVIRDYLPTLVEACDEIIRLRTLALSGGPRVE